MTKHSVLIVAPHPDDETLGCGGTLAKRVDEGCRVTVVVVTDGSQLFRLSEWKIEVDPTPAEASAMRKAETQKAVGILGGDGNAIRFLDFGDATLTEHIEEAAEILAEMIKEVEADEIYVTSEYEWHSDHVAACQAARVAMEKAASSAKLYRYTVLLPDGIKREEIDQPTMRVDISNQSARKREAANQFRSHLDIVGKRQTKPFFDSVESWLGDVEEFFVDEP